jgi:uncharacterized protein (DUF362 family)
MKVVVRRIDHLEKSVEELLEELEWKSIILPNDGVIIKPNFLTKPRVGVTTNLELLSSVVDLIKERTDNVAVVETDFSGRNFDAIAKKLELSCTVVNLSREKEIMNWLEIIYL